MTSIIALLTLLTIGQAASAITVMTCEMKDKAIFLVLDEENLNGRPTYTLELIDPTALTPLAHLNLWENQALRGPAVRSVDHFESHVGDLQLVAVFPVGGFKSKHVYFNARFGRDANNGGSYGLKKLEEASSAEWTCEE